MTESLLPQTGVRTKMRTLCRACHVSCSLVVEMEGGRPIKIYGDKDNPISHGYSCIRGRESFKCATLPSRLKTSLVRRGDGAFDAIGSDMAARAVAGKLRAIIAEHGPRAVALYAGTFSTNTLTKMFAMALMDAIGSPMFFTPMPIDQPGKPIADALHGSWLGGVRRGIEGIEVMLLFGSNPLESIAGPFGTSPDYNLREAKSQGTKLIVCDPRRTETAKRADIFLQVRPGEDAALMAGIIRVILSEALYDKSFVEAEADGLEAIRSAVDPFTPACVEARTDIAAADLIATARTYAGARRAIIHVGTGPNMSGRSTLCEYLGRVLTTLCGNWPRAGERLGNPGVLMKFAEPMAATPGPTPAIGLGEAMRVHGLSKSAAGMPTSVLPDEILLPGKGQVQALVVIGGNPMLAFPDQEKTFEAMKALELLVCLDPHLSATAKLAHYVIAPKLFLEMPAVSGFWEQLITYGTLYGYDVPYQQYTPAVVAPPAGADVIEDWQFIYQLARHMGLQLTLRSASIVTGNPDDVAANSTRLDMTKDITTEEALAYAFRGSPVPYEEVKRKAVGGHVFDVPEKRIAPKPAGWAGRFDIGNATMMAQLGAVAAETHGALPHGRPFRLTARRFKDIYNSSWTEHEMLKRKWRCNPAFMHPSDMDAVGFRSGDIVRIESDRASILAIAQADADMKIGCISMSHGWGPNPDEPEDPRELGSTPNRLCDNSKDCDSISWIPLMSAIPVSAYRVDEQFDTA